MSLTIIKAGVLDTIQDLGRYGYGSWGVNPGGAMDRYATQVAQLLVGNETCEAAIEMHFPAPQILFNKTMLISITGGDFTPVLNDQPVSLWKPIVVRKNTILQFLQWRQGARCYLAVHGGFRIEKWLDSNSTNLKAGAGGWMGRKLEKNDEIRVGESRISYGGLLKEDIDLKCLNWRASIRIVYANANEIHFIPGNEWNILTEDSKKHLLSESFSIHSLSDRMGYHLTGIPLTVSAHSELLSSGVSFGTMQLLPGGQIIVLMADHQTTGGYPRIGHIISAHLPKFAQLRPGDAVRFVMTDIQAAEDILLSQQRELNILKRSCIRNLNKMTC